MDAESGDRRDPILPGKIRWLAAASGCLSAVAGSTGLGLGFAIVASPLIVGAIVQPRFRRLGRALVAAGALYLSFWVFFYGVWLLFDVIRNLRRYHDCVRLGIASLWLASIFLIGWCDVALVIEAVERKRVRRTQKT
ncbi:MAG TPA: hypothetical protein VMT28_17515 [Terriglobales bacterium]|nr:hypothetical protein [Terriglobales bacterium]